MKQFYFRGELIKLFFLGFFVKNLKVKKLGIFMSKMKREKKMCSERKNKIKLYTLFCIFSCPRHLESKSWKFLWSPFNSDFKTVLILIPSIKID